MKLEKKRRRERSHWGYYRPDGDTHSLCHVCLAWANWGVLYVTISVTTYGFSAAAGDNSLCPETVTSSSSARADNTFETIK